MRPIRLEAIWQRGKLIPVWNMKPNQVPMKRKKSVSLNTN
jgi:hypothetical protein